MRHRKDHLRKWRGRSRLSREPISCKDYFRPRLDPKIDLGRCLKIKRSSHVLNLKAKLLPCAQRVMKRA